MVNDKEQVNEILGFARTRPKTKTITVKKRPPEEPSLRDKVIAKRKEWAKQRATKEEMRDENIKRKAEYVKIRQEAIMVGTAGNKPRGPRTKNLNPLTSKKVNPNSNDYLRSKGTQGRHVTTKATTSTQSIKQQQANRKRSQQGALRAYGKKKMTLNRVL
jgi:hypothetical protein